MNNYTKKIILLLSCVGFLTISACTPKLGGDDYDVQSVGQVSKTLKGTIVATRKIKIRESDMPQQPGAGAAVGGIGGAVAGSTIGGGNKMPLVSAVIGGVAGGFAGHAIEQKLKEQDGVEYQVQLDRGDLITIAQGKEPALSVGQRVLVIESSKYRARSRIIADHTN
jgi:outer membrane lipoprotein SlyB